MTKPDSLRKLKSSTTTTSNILQSQLDYLNVRVLNLENENHHQVGA